MPRYQIGCVLLYFHRRIRVPNEQTAKVAIATVKQWIAEYPEALDLILFNVFQDRDLKIYERLLTEDE